MSESTRPRNKSDLRLAPKNNVEYLLAAGLETWVHQVLYLRHVYPKATFGNVRFSGIQCSVNRHPDVVKYIHDTVSLAVPGIVQGSVDQISLMITCYEHSSEEGLDEMVEECKKLEECQILFRNFHKDRLENSPDNGDAELKQCFRDMILRLGSLESMPCNYLNATGLSFRLELGMSRMSPESVPMQLHAALAEGLCLESTSDWETKGKGIVARPLCQSDLSFARVNLFHRRIQKMTRDRHSSSVKNNSTGSASA